MIPVLVGLSRVALRVHYPSDVIGGWSFGIAVAATAAAGSVVLSARSDRRVHSPA